MIFSSGLIYAQEVGHTTGEYKFLENKGQWPAHVNFKADVPGGNIWLEKSRIIYQFIEKDDFHAHIGEDDPKFEHEAKEHLIYVKFIGANDSAKLEKSLPTTEYYNFFKGNDRNKWATNVKAYRELVYKDFYPGIDLKFFEHEGQLKYEYEVAPGADPSKIKLKYYGAKKVKITNEGELVAQGALGEIIEEKPKVYQIKNGRIVDVACEYVLTDDQVVTFKLGYYDPSLKLIIDPILVFATYSGAPSDNFGMTATYAYDGKAYSAGMVFGNNYPAPAPAWNDTPNITVFSTGILTTDAFISKYSEDGTSMIWTNFVGGGNNTQGTETAQSLICDKDNNIYLYGVTSSLDFPTSVNAYQDTLTGGTPLVFNSTGTNFHNTGTDIYVVKISSDGLSFLGGTYVGGSGNDGVNYKVTSGSYPDAASYDSLTTNYGDQFRGEIMLDSLDNVIIASHTRSTDFPVLNAIQPTNAGQQDGVIFKLDADFTSMMWSTYFGGSQNDGCYSVKLDSSYNIIIAGGTSSTDLPGTAGGLNPAYMGGKTDGFIAKLTPDASTLTQTTYMGTASYDQVFFIEVDRWDNIYVVGQSNGSMPVINAPYFNANSGQFITKLLPDLATVDYSTVFGNGDGNFDISPSAFLVDVCGNVYVSGWGANILQTVPLNGMPVTTDAFQLTPPNGFDFYLFVLERDAQSLLYASYLGDASSGEHVDGGTSRFDKFGIVYQSVCGGCGGSSGFPTTPGAWSNQNLSSNCNNLVFKFDFEIVPVADFEISDIEGCAPFTFILDNESNDTINSVWDFPVEAIILQGGINPQIMFTDPGTYEIYLSITDTICNLVDTAVKTVYVYESIDYLITSNDTILCDMQPIDLVATTNGTANIYIWSDDPNFSNQLNSGPLDSIISVNPLVTTTYYVTVSNGWPLCDLIDSVVVEVMDGPDADFLLSDIEGCAPFVVDLDNESSDTLNTVWHYPPGTVVLSGGVNPQLSFPNPGVYNILLTLYDPICNLTDSATQTVTVHEGINYSIPNDTLLCDFPTFDLIANGYGTVTSFTWADDTSFTNVLNSGPMDSTITISPTETTIYYILISNGWTVCDIVDSVQIFFTDDVVELVAPDTICLGDTTLIAANTTLPASQIDFVWSPSNYIIYDQDSIIFVNPPTSMWFHLTWTNAGCVADDSVWIQVNNIDSSTVYATATPDYVASGATTTLEAFPNDPTFSYFWFPPTGLSSQFTQTTTAVVQEPITYQVVIEGLGCTRTTFVTIETYEFICGDIYIFVPSAFTPNGDGENDMLYVRGENLLEVEFMIFDRWGEKVFETTDQSVGWDGTFKGKPVDPDVYVYHLTAICFDGQESLIKGNISLLR